MDRWWYWQQMAQQVLRAVHFHLCLIRLTQLEVAPPVEVHLAVVPLAVVPLAEVHRVEVHQVEVPRAATPKAVQAIVWVASLVRVEKFDP